MKKIIGLLVLIFITFSGFSQEETEDKEIFLREYQKIIILILVYY